MQIAGIRTDLTARLDLQGPLIQAPMAGGATTPELVAAVSNAGALGSLGGAYLNSIELEKAVRQIKTLTRRPFAVNLFAPSLEPVLNENQIQAATAATRSYRQELGIPVPPVRPPFSPNFDEQLSVVLKERPAVFSFTFGLPDGRFLNECRKRGILTFGTATTLEDALALEEGGVDAVVAQGVEAGAQRGTFSPEKEDPLIGLTALIPTLVSRLRIPVIAAGGIMNGRGIAAALTLGAQAAQLGTAFLACDESGISETYRNALLDPKRGATRLTRAFTGRWARGLENRFIVEMAAKENAILPFPAQNTFTQDIRKKAAELGLSDYLSLWAGQGVGLIRAMKAASLVETLFKETSDAMPVAS
ncbi:MAG: NAD(P)H-dependent flavin oxidoreductase [Candidatus Binatia bacterium]